MFRSSRGPLRRTSWNLRFAGSGGPANAKKSEENECFILRETAQDRRMPVPSIITDLDSPDGSFVSEHSLTAHLAREANAYRDVFDDDADDAAGCLELPDTDAKGPDVPIVGIGGARKDQDFPPVSAWSIEEPSTCDNSRASGEDKSKGARGASGLGTTPGSTTFGSSSTPSKWGPFRRSSRTRADLSPLSKKKMALMKDAESCMQRLTRSKAYELLSAVLIILNALFIVWETQQRAIEAIDGRVGASDSYFSVLSNFFCMCFVMDLVLRISAEKSAFFLRRERAWNVMDVFVVITALGEVSVQWYQFASGASSAGGLRLFLRKFSMLRIARLLRVVRRTKAMWVIKFIKELRIMVLCLVGAVKSFMWSVVLLLLVLTVFGVFFTDGTVAFCLEHKLMASGSTTELRKYFGTLSRSVLSLFKAMSGGEDWAAILDSLDPLPYEYTLFFLFFIAFGILALLNVVTAVFVGAALQRTQQDRELLVQEQIDMKSEFRQTMEQIFYELDLDGTGELNMDEFESYMEDEKIKAFLSTCQLDIDQVKTMFVLIDTDKTGSVDLEEFIAGCFKLRGGATSMEIAFLNFRVEQIQNHIEAMQDLMGHPRQEQERPCSRMIRTASNRPRRQP